MDREPSDIIADGIASCRQSRLEEGYALLKRAAVGGFPENCPSVAYSYLGYGMAALEARYNDGVAACKRAIDLEFYQPENFWNLARTYLLLGSRRKAIAEVRRGLRIDPSHPQLLRLKQQLGIRRRPVIPFLHRRHPLNRLLGRLRHDLRAPTQRPKQSD